LTRLLLVDDDEDNLALFNDVLINCGFVVDAYSDPVRALLEFKANHYDLLILDYFMPLDGLELFRRVRKIDKSPKLILLTASQEQLSTNDIEEHLQFKVVRKPVTITKFIQEISASLAGNKKSQYMFNRLS
jgi:two-component system, OmpR family, response regulator Irr